MNRQERNIGAMCPRGCGRRLMRSYNPISKIDGAKICMECHIDEIYLIVTKEEMENE